MSYDPFGRGPHPVGARGATITDPSRDRELPMEVWYPADASHRGQDLAAETADRYEVLPGFPPVRQAAVRDARPAAGRWPLVAFAHGYGGHRRQSTFLCTHLASHGYVVASVDHPGNTVRDIFRQTVAERSGGDVPSLRKNLEESLLDRPSDVRFLMDRVLDGRLGDLAGHVAGDRIGMSGHSFGGWTTMAVVDRDRRVRAAVGLAPAGGFTPGVPNPLAEALALDWERPVPTLILSAELDTIVPHPSIDDLYRRLPEPKRMLVLANADHMHFCDRSAQVHEIFRKAPAPGGFALAAARSKPFSELCPAEIAYDFVRGPTLVHFDATLKGSADAAGFLDDIHARLEERGVRTVIASGV